MSSIRTIVAAAALLAGCGQGFRVADYPTPASLYEAGLEQFRLGKWESAVTAFEQVTLQLPARDTLLPRAHFFLAQAHGHRKDYQLAAASYLRLFEGYQGDTLADDALFGAAESYEKAWRGPEFDPDYAQKSLEAYELVQRLFPGSELVRSAQEGEARMTDGLARKELSNGMYYYRRNAFHSALIYFGYAVTDYPGTPGAREARLMMVRSYQQLGYREDVAGHCRALLAEYPGASDVRALCGDVAT